MTSALVLGKFLPPHAGHVYLVERARELADDVVVLLLAHSAEPIPVSDLMVTPDAGASPFVTSTLFVVV